MAKLSYGCAGLVAVIGGGSSGIGLATAEKLRREFIANISHELRTPVTVIRGSLEALRDGVVTEPEDVAGFHEQMYNESLFLQRLINDLLDLSRHRIRIFLLKRSPWTFVLLFRMPCVALVAWAWKRKSKFMRSWIRSPI